MAIVWDGYRTWQKRLERVVKKGRLVPGRWESGN